MAKAKAEAVIMEKKATGEIDWDLEMAKGSQSSWKDEWLTILFSIPLILAFIPGMEEVVKKSLKLIEKSAKCPLLVENPDFNGIF